MNCWLWLFTARSCTRLSLPPLSRPRPSSRHADTFLRAKNWNRKLKLCSTCHKLVSAIGWQFSRRCHVSKCFAIFSRPPNNLLAHPLLPNPLDSLSCKQHACLGFLSHLIAFLLVFYSLLVLLCVCAGVSVFECCLPQQEYCVGVCVNMCVWVCVCAASAPNWPRLASLRCWHVFRVRVGREVWLVKKEEAREGGGKSRVARWAGLMPAYNYADIHTGASRDACHKGHFGCTLQVARVQHSNSMPSPHLLHLSLPIPRYLAELGVKWNGKW